MTCGLHLAHQGFSSGQVSRQKKKVMDVTCPRNSRTYKKNKENSEGKMDCKGRIRAKASKKI